MGQQDSCKTLVGGVGVVYVSYMCTTHYTCMLQCVIEILQNIINHTIGPSKITKISEMWASLVDNEKEEWKEKACKGMYLNNIISTPEQKKKAMHELISITQENVS